MRVPQKVKDSVQEQVNNAFYHDFRKHEGAVVDIDDTGVGADTEFSVRHNLDYLPDQVELLTKTGQTDAYLTIKPSGTAWTRTLAYLKCSEANAALRVRIS